MACVARRAVRVTSCWLGPAATFTPPHTDPLDNLFAQVAGRKVVDVCAPTGAPGAARGEWQRAELRAGDVLFIPAGWWHCVYARTASFSISSWFDAGSARRPVSYTHLTLPTKA